MSGNVVKAFMTTGTIMKGIKPIMIGIATQTSDWHRPEWVVTEDTKTGFKAAVENDTVELPEKTEKVVMREPQHGTDNHFTAVLLTSANEYIESRHY